MPSSPFILASPDLTPPGREWWFMDPTAGPEMTSATVSFVFYAWNPRNLNVRLNEIKDEYDIPRDEKQRFIAGRKFTFYDVERITRIFLDKRIIGYGRFCGATHILIWMGRNHNMI